MVIIFSTNSKDIALVADYISAGRVIAFPTNTSYGLAVNALDGHALQRLRNIKNRPDEKPFTVFLADKIWTDYIDLTQPEIKLLAKMKNKPLTLLVKPKPSLRHLASNNLIGLRVIDHPAMEELASTILLPLTATSANKADASPCSSSQCIVAAFPGLLPDSQINEDDPKGASKTTYDLSLAAIIDAGQLPATKPTTIAQVINKTIKIVRPGELLADDLQAAL